MRAVYIRDVDHANTELDALLTAAAKPWGARVAGLDCEWRPNFSPGPESPVALVQVALGRTVLLLQVSAMRGKRFVLQLFFLTRRPKPLNRISFEIKNTVRRPYHTEMWCRYAQCVFISHITIARFSCFLFLTTKLDDCKRLYRDYGVSTQGGMELSYLSRFVDPHIWPSDPDSKKNTGLIGLARLARTYKQRRLGKNQRVQLSNWEAVLTNDQQSCEYIQFKFITVLTSYIDAANDAHVSMALALDLFARAPPRLDHYQMSFNIVNGIATRGNGLPIGEASSKASEPEALLEKPLFKEPLVSTKTEQNQVLIEGGEDAAQKAN